MYQNQTSLFQNIHLSCSSFWLDLSDLTLCKTSVCISATTYTDDISSMPAISSILNGMVITNKLTPSDPKSTVANQGLSYCVFGGSIKKVFDSYLRDCMSILPNKNAVKVFLKNSKVYIDVDWCTNFYNAYGQTSLIPYAARPNFLFGFSQCYKFTSSLAHFHFNYIKLIFDV